MKIRVYSPYFPHPVTEGAHQVIYDQVRFLGLYHDVELITWKSRSDLADVSAFPPKVKWIDWSKKTKESDIEVRQENLGAKLLRVAKSFFSRSASPEIFYYPPNVDQRRRLGECDLAIYHYSFSHSWLSRFKNPNEKRVSVYFHNLESNVFFDRAKQELNAFKKSVHLLNAKKLKRNEIALNFLSDEIWQISEVDLKDYAVRCDSDGSKEKSVESFEFKKARQVYRPPTFDADQFLNQQKHLSEWPVLGFLGGLDFLPNLQSLDWILSELAPALKAKNFNGKIVSVGKNAPDWILKKGSEFSFYEHLGFVRDLENFWSHLTVMLIPHVTGSGVRIKLLESMARGIHVMCNKAALDRIHADLKTSPLVFCSEDPAAWAAHILERTNFAAQKKPEFPRALSAAEVYKDFIR